MTVPKAKREPSDRQVRELVKLLLVWPQVPGKTAQKFIFQTLDIKMTRSAFQEARRLLGLAIPEHTEATVKKRAFAKLVIAQLAGQHGIISLKEEDVRREVRKAIKTQFGEDTNTVLLNSWVKEFSHDIREKHYSAIVTEATEDLIRLGVIWKSEGRQQELL